MQSSFCLGVEFWVNELYLDHQKSLVQSLAFWPLRWPGKLVCVCSRRFCLCSRHRPLRQLAAWTRGRWVCCACGWGGLSCPKQSGSQKALSSTNGLNANQSLPWWKPESSKFGIKLWQTGIWRRANSIWTHTPGIWKPLNPILQDQWFHSFCSYALLSLQLS